MKSRLIKMSIATALTFGSMLQGVHAQEAEKKPAESNGRAVKEGTVAVDLYYGFPNFTYEIFRANRDLEKYHSSILGPTGIRGEYFVSDHIAFGVDANYSRGEMSWLNSREIRDSLGSTHLENFNDQVTITRLRILGKFNFHFGKSEIMDMYVGGGFGYNNTVFDYAYQNYHYHDVLEAFTTIPFSWRINFGGKVYFTKNI